MFFKYLIIADRIIQNVSLHTFRNTKSLRDSGVRASWCRRVEGGTQRRLVEGALSFPEKRAACGPVCLGLSVVVDELTLVLNLSLVNRTK